MSVGNKNFKRKLLLKGLRSMIEVTIPQIGTITMVRHKAFPAFQKYQP